MTEHAPFLRTRDSALRVSLDMLLMLAALTSMAYIFYGWRPVLLVLIGVVCAIKGYTIFGKRESTKGIIISTVIAFIVLVLAWYLCLSYDVYDAYQLWYEEGHVDFTLTFFESVANAHLFLEEPEIASAYFKDLGLGLLFCVIGAFGYVKAAIGKAKR